MKLHKDILDSSCAREIFQPRFELLLSPDEQALTQSLEKENINKEISIEREILNREAVDETERHFAALSEISDQKVLKTLIKSLGIVPAKAWMGLVPDLQNFARKNFRYKEVSPIEEITRKEMQNWLSTLEEIKEKKSNSIRGRTLLSFLKNMKKSGFSLTGNLANFSLSELFCGMKEVSVTFGACENEFASKILYRFHCCVEILIQNKNNSKFDEKLDNSFREKMHGLMSSLLPFLAKKITLTAQILSKTNSFFDKAQKSKSGLKLLKNRKELELWYSKIRPHKNLIELISKLKNPEIQTKQLKIQTFEKLSQNQISYKEFLKICNLEEKLAEEQDLEVSKKTKLTILQFYSLTKDFNQNLDSEPDKMYQTAQSHLKKLFEFISNTEQRFFNSGAEHYTSEQLFIPDLLLKTCAKFSLGYLNQFCKFCHFSFKIMHNIIYKGFCVKPEEDEGSEGAEGSSEYDFGTGVGEGQGEHNNTEKYEFEEQLLGEKGEKEEEPQNQEEEQQDEKDDAAMEMENDFEGKNEEQTEKEKEEEEQKNEDQLDEEFDQVDADDEEKKLWNEENEEMKQDDDENAEDEAEDDQNELREEEDVEFEGEKKGEDELEAKAKEHTEKETRQAEEDYKQLSGEEDEEGDDQNDENKMQEEQKELAEVEELSSMSKDDREQQMDFNKENNIEEEENPEEVQEEDLEFDENKGSDLEESQNNSINEEELPEERMMEEEHQPEAGAEEQQQQAAAEPFGEAERQQGKQGGEEADEKKDEKEFEEMLEEEKKEDDLNEKNGKENKENPIKKENFDFEKLKKIEQTLQILHNENEQKEQNEIGRDDFDALEQVEDDDPEAIRIVASGLSHMNKNQQKEKTKKEKDENQREKPKLTLQEDFIEKNSLSPPNEALNPEAPQTGPEPSSPTSLQKREKSSGEAADFEDPSGAGKKLKTEKEENLIDEPKYSLENIVELMKLVSGSEGARKGNPEIWNRLEQVLRDHAVLLSEELRSILKPTKIAGLKGDYRTGKRLNMRKVISFIASNYRKDKIWLRRAEPTQKDYQIHLAIDDSLSMKEKNVGFFALEALTTLMIALDKIEVGEICVSAIRNGMHVVHPFEKQLMLSAGPELVSHFDFSYSDHQSADWGLAKFMRESLDLFSKDSRHKICFVVSDGRFNKDLVRPLCLESQELGALYVYIILDFKGSKQSVVNYKSTKAVVGEDGKVKMEIKPYLEDFPFQNYIIVKEVKELSSVLVSILKEYFENFVE